MFKLDDGKVPDGTVLLMGVRYEAQTSDKVWTYALLKAGGVWYVTGNDKAPKAAGWGAINRWLERDGRIVLWVRVATGWADLYPSKIEGVKTTGIIVGEETDPRDEEPSYYDAPGRIRVQ